jgi:site-specific recombinase XerC
MLHRHEECLLRGWLQGVSWGTLGELYLEGASAEVTRATVEDLRRRLIRKAQRLGRPDLAATLRKERRLTPAWEAALRPALETLLRLPEPQPTPASAVADWLPAAIAAPLQAHGLTTLGEVKALLAQQGQEFWRPIPRLGPKAARTLREFFRKHAPTLGPLPAAPAPAPLAGVLAPPPPRSGLAPLEQFRIPEGLDGSQGENRAAGRCRLAASHDYEAITSWLNRWPADSLTYRTYRKEAERLLLWALLERGKPFSSLTPEDCLAYRRFLAEPTPAARWVGPLQPRFSLDWRPFQGGLSERSRQQAEGILSALCGWLVGQRYLDSNPFEGLPKLRFRARLRADRALSETHWQWLLGYAEQRAQASRGRARRRYARLVLLLRFAYGTGLRLHELAAARLDHLEWRTDSKQGWLHVRGKGQKLREVPIPERLWQALEAAWTARGLPKDPAAAPPDTPLLTALRRVAATADGAGEPTWEEAALTPSGLHQTFKAFFREAGAALAREDPAAGRRLLAASAHWLRHTHGSHAVRRGVPIELVRDNLGHSSLATTSIYIHTDRDQRYREMAKLSEERPRDGE